MINNSQWFMIQNTGWMNRNMGIYDSKRQIYDLKDRVKFRNTRFIFRITGSLTSSGVVYLTTRNDIPQDNFSSSHNSTTSSREPFPFLMSAFQALRKKMRIKVFIILIFFRLTPKADEQKRWKKLIVL